MSDLVEIGALAIWRTRDARFPPRVRRPNPDAFDAVSGAHDFVREEAAAVLTAIEKAGYRIVPVEPDAAWLQATYEQLDNYTRHQINLILSAALAAAPKVP